MTAEKALNLLWSSKKPSPAEVLFRSMGASAPVVAQARFGVPGLLL